MDTSIYAPNAILFILDPRNGRIEIPNYDKDNLTAATDSCISVGTQADVDGPVTVRLDSSSTAIDNKLLSNVFSGRIQTPSKRIAVVTAEAKSAVHIDVPTNETFVSVWVDDSATPSIIAVEVE